MKLIDQITISRIELTKKKVWRHLPPLEQLRDFHGKHICENVDGLSGLMTLTDIQGGSEWWINGWKTIKIWAFDNLFSMYAIYASISFVRDTNMSNKYHLTASNREKTKWRKSSEKIFCWFSILMQFPKNWKSCWSMSNI